MGEDGVGGSPHLVQTAHQDAVVVAVVTTWKVFATV